MVDGGDDVRFGERSIFERSGGDAVVEELTNHWSLSAIHSTFDLERLEEFEKQIVAKGDEGLAKGSALARIRRRAL